MIKKVLHILNLYKNTILKVVILILFGYILYQFSLVVSAEPDQSYITSQRYNITKHFQFDKNTIDSVEKLLNVSTNTTVQLGKNDPFSP